MRDSGFRSRHLRKRSKAASANSVGQVQTHCCDQYLTGIIQSSFSFMSLSSGSRVGSTAFNRAGGCRKRSVREGTSIRSAPNMCASSQSANMSSWARNQGYLRVRIQRRITPADHRSTADVCCVLRMRISGARNPRVPDRGAPGKSRIEGFCRARATRELLAVKAFRDRWRSALRGRTTCGGPVRPLSEREAALRLRLDRPEIASASSSSPSPSLSPSLFICACWSGLGGTGPAAVLDCREAKSGPAPSGRPEGKAGPLLAPGPGSVIGRTEAAEPKPRLEEVDQGVEKEKSPRTVTLFRAPSNAFTQSSNVGGVFGDDGTDAESNDAAERRARLRPIPSVWSVPVSSSPDDPSRCRLCGVLRGPTRARVSGVEEVGGKAGGGGSSEGRSSSSLPLTALRESPKSTRQKPERLSKSWRKLLGLTSL